MPDNQTRSQKPKKSPANWALARLWLLLTQPPASLTDLLEKKYARLVASLTLALTLILPISFLIGRDSPNFGGPQDVVRLFLFISVLVSYALSRTPFYKISAYLTVFLLSIFSYIFVLVNSTHTSEDLLAAIVTLIPISLGITAALLPPAGVFSVALLHLVALNLLPLSEPGLNPQFAAAFSGGAFSLGVLLTIVSAYRNNTEKEIIENLESSNAEINGIRATLEERVEERSEELNRRSTQLEAAAQVARSAAEVRDLNELLTNVVWQITERFGFYHAGIFLADANGQFVVLQAASSDGGQRMVKRGHRLEVGRQGIVGYAAYQKRPRIAQNVGADATFFNNPDLPLTRSEIALPLEVQNRLIGVLDIQSDKDHAFTNDDIYSLQAMADQIALAIENARLIQESQNVVTQLQALGAESTATAWREHISNAPKGFSYSTTGATTISPDQPPADQEEGVHTLKVSLVLRGKKIGDILLRRKPNEKPWGQAEQEMAERISAQVALAVENARLLEETQRRAIREQTLNDLSARFSRSLDVEALLQSAARELQRLPQVSTVSVVVSPAESEETAQQKA